MDSLPEKSRFDWIDVLERLSKGERYTRGVYHELLEYAAGWPTCACGQLCTLLPRDEYTKAPEDAWLRSWGVRFALEVENEKWCKALATFQKIEAHSKQLLIEGGHIDDTNRNVPTTKEHTAVH